MDIDDVIDKIDGFFETRRNVRLFLGMVLGLLFSIVLGYAVPLSFFGKILFGVLYFACIFVFVFLIPNSILDFIGKKDTDYSERLVITLIELLGILMIIGIGWICWQFIESFL